MDIAALFIVVLLPLCLYFLFSPLEYIVPHQWKQKNSFQETPGLLKTEIMWNYGKLKLNIQIWDATWFHLGGGEIEMYYFTFKRKKSTWYDG